MRDLQRRRHDGAHAGLRAFCEQHGLVLTSIADLIAYIKEGNK